MEFFDLGFAKLWIATTVKAVLRDAFETCCRWIVMAKDVEMKLLQGLIGKIRSYYRRVVHDCKNSVFLKSDVKRTESQQ